MIELHRGHDKNNNYDNYNIKDTRIKELTEIARLYLKYPNLGMFIYRNKLNEEYIDSILYVLTRCKDIFGEYYNQNDIEISLRGYLCSPKSLRGRYFYAVCMYHKVDRYLIGLLRDMDENDS